MTLKFPQLPDGYEWVVDRGKGEDEAYLVRVRIRRDKWLHRLHWTSILRYADLRNVPRDEWDDRINECARDAWRKLMDIRRVPDLFADIDATAAAWQEKLRSGNA